MVTKDRKLIKTSDMISGGGMLVQKRKIDVLVRSSLLVVLS